MSVLSSRPFLHSLGDTFVFASVPIRCLWRGRGAASTLAAISFHISRTHTVGAQENSPAANERVGEEERKIEIS